MCLRLSVESPFQNSGVSIIVEAEGISNYWSTSLSLLFKKWDHYLCLPQHTAPTPHNFKDMTAKTNIIKRL